MTSDTSTSRGRPRDEERTQAILAATHEVMHTKGWNEVTVGDIAKEAGCGLATIYRRWANKEELVAAAMLERPLPEIDDTGDARLDLRLLVVAMATELGQMGSSIIGFLAATQSDETLHDAFSESVISMGRPRFSALLRDILGDDSPHIDLLVDAILGALMTRAGVIETLGDPDDFGDEVMALIDALTA